VPHHEHVSCAYLSTVLWKPLEEWSYNSTNS